MREDVTGPDKRPISLLIFEGLKDELFHKTVGDLCDVMDEPKCSVPIDKPIELLGRRNGFL